MALSRKSMGMILLGVTAVTLVIVAVSNRRTPLPGKNQQAEIIEVGTGKRTPVMWDEIFAKYKPRQSPGNGVWIVNYPQGTDQWAFVVNAGAADPSATTMPAKAGAGPQN